MVSLYSSYRPPKLNYTILYNSSRSLRFQQLIFGSPNKPDGRTGLTGFIVSVLLRHVFSHTHTEIAIMLDRIFISKVTGRPVDISVDVATFPVIYQQESVESKQVMTLPNSYPGLLTHTQLIPRPFDSYPTHTQLIPNSCPTHTQAF